MEFPLRTLLLDSSNGVIGEYELSRLNLAANLKKEMRGTMEQILDALVEARLARWFLENKEELRSTGSPFHIGQECFDFGGDPNGYGTAALDAPKRSRRNSN